MGKPGRTVITGLEVPPRHMFIGVREVTEATNPARAAAGGAVVVKRREKGPPIAELRAGEGRVGPPTPAPTPSSGGMRRSPEEDDRVPSRSENTAVVSAEKLFKESKGCWEEGVRMAKEHVAGGA